MAGFADSLATLAAPQMAPIWIVAGLQLALSVAYRSSWRCLAGCLLAIGAATYFAHFDLDGNAHYRGLELGPGPGGAGLSLAGTF